VKTLPAGLPAVGRAGLPSFMFLVFLSFLIGYIFSFRFDCRITLNSENLAVRYLFPFKKTIRIKIYKIIEFDKHEDTLYRYHKKIFIKTSEGDYLVRYNISDEADEKFLTALKKVIVN
jgi:hypothetical protein